MTSIWGFVPKGTSRRRLFEETAACSLRPRTFLVFGAISMVAAALRMARWDLGSNVDGMYFLSASLLVLAAGGVIAVVVSRMLSRRWLPLAAILLWTCTGAIRRLTEISVALRLSAEGADVSPSPIIHAVASTLAWVTLIAGLQAVNALRREATETSERSIRRLQRLSATRLEQLQEERATMARWIRRTVTPELDQLSQLVASSPPQWRAPGFAAGVEEVAESAREVVRRASHTMNRLAVRVKALDEAADDVGEVLPRPKAALVVREVRISPVASALGGITVLGLSAPAIRPSIMVALAVAVVVALAMLWLLQPLADAIYSKLRLPRLALVLVANAVAVVAAILAADQAVRWLTAHSSLSGPDAPFTLPFLEPGYLIIVIVATWLVTTGAALVVADGTVWAQAEARIDATRAALSKLDQEMERQYEQMCAQTRAMLHGPIQGRLATIAMSLRFDRYMVEPKTVESCRELLAACRQDLTRLTLDPFDEHRSTEEVLIELRKQWSGLLEISWHVDSSARQVLDGSSAVLRSFEALTADLASNSSRHGSAHTLQLSVIRGEEGLRVVARDDGRGPNTPVMMGVGLGDGRAGVSQITMNADGWCEVTAHLAPS